MAVKAVLSTSEPPREEQMPNKIKEVLEEWGGDWMWKSLRILGNVYAGEELPKDRKSVV